MLLRRITKHVKDQNWFAVGIDFWIVVIGVFFGIQIGNWNETRLDQVAYGQAYDRMVIEARNNIETLEETNALHAPMIQNFRSAIEDIRACRDDEESKGRIEAAVESISSTMSPKYHNTAISHLTTSERLLERQTIEHREHYLKYAKSLSSRMKFSQTMFENMEARAYDLHSFIDYGPYFSTAGKSNLADIWGDQRSLVLVVEPAIACQDDAFRKLFYRWESGHAYQVTLMTAIIAETKLFLEELGEDQIVETNP